MEEKLHKLCKPITLYNIKTGETRTWKSRYLCASELETSQVVISALSTGRQKTFNGEWIMSKKNRKGRTIKSVENFSGIDMTEYCEFKEAYENVSRVQEKYKSSDIQSEGKFNDKTMCIELDVQEFNNSKHGWDGRKDGRIGFENKNEKFYKRHNLNATYQDLSDNVLTRFAAGGLGCNSTFTSVGRCAYCVIYSIKDIYHLLCTKRRGVRNNANITLEDAINNGGKIVAIEFDEENTYNSIIRNYPSLKNRIRPNDIHSRSEARSIATEMAYR